MSITRRGGSLLLGGLAIAGALLTVGPERVAAAAVAPFRTVVGGAEQRPSYPCRPGQVKVDLMRRHYLPPGHPRYAEPGADITCADTADAAQRKGFRPAN
jgi:hypothetical protein